MMIIRASLGSRLGSSVRPRIHNLQSLSCAHHGQLLDLTAVANQGRGRGYQGRRLLSMGPLLENAIGQTQQLITGLHLVTGTPWFITIPLVALSINLIARLPLTLYMQRIRQRRAELTPLLQAWYARHVRDVRSEPNPLTETAAIEKVNSRFKESSKRLYREFGLQEWKFYTNFMVLPVWLTAIEALRQMAGGRRGLLGTLVFGNENKGNSTGGQAFDAESSISVSAASSSSDLISGTDTLAMGDSVVRQLPSTLQPGMDLSMASGGCLWFPDLTAPDPLHILPILLSTVLVLNVLPMTVRETRAIFNLPSRELPGPTGSEVILPQTGRRRMQRALVVLSALVGPLTMDLPAALHLYWLSTATITYVQSQVIGRMMKLPDRSNIRPCKGSEPFFPRLPS
ncbi:hypothetical protein VTK73DRAFT_6386 [Phialemonium thermophilum]|uniref:Mitochondrial inner membrane protein COX18 n=1 Tax=Phialemonium thermophilum TaxID=223376 RepID=A0ABR3XVG6_9PEZI